MKKMITTCKLLCNITHRQVNNALFFYPSFTDVFTEEGESGTPNATGYYTGMIGQLQRHEVDFGALLVRADSLAYDVVKLGPVFTYADMAIITMQQPDRPRSVDVMDVHRNFDVLHNCF